MHDRNPVTRGQLVGKRACSVRRVVVDDDELAVNALGVVSGKNFCNEISEAIAFVVRRDDDGECGRRLRRNGQGWNSQAL
jgi:hypothetical protein